MSRALLRALSLAALVALMLGLPAIASGAGASYVVVQCDAQNRATADAQIREERGYVINRLCSDPAEENALKISSSLARADKGNAGTVFWRAPSDTGFVGVRLEAKLRRDAGHKALLFMADAERRETKRIATGDNSAGPFKSVSWDGARQPVFQATLRCDETPYCPESEQAKTWIRDIRIKVADFRDPTVAVGGPLLNPGWRRGAQALGYSAGDTGSGLRQVDVRVNGDRITSTGGECAGTIAGTDLASRLRPCSEDPVAGTVNPSTATTPFREGENAVSVCARDFPGNETCETRTVNVDNIPPSLAFTNAQDPDDPELIQAVVSDATSGVASGQIYFRAAGEELWRPLETQLLGGALRARVDSTAVPPGTYQFRAVARDVAGNQVETTRRLDGLEKQLDFPLKAGVDLSARLEPGGSRRTTIPYGTRSQVAGVLRDASGAPLRNQEVVVVENFGDGALIRERVSYAETDSRGRWHERLPAGPSRRVVATYAGTQRYLPDETLGGSLKVRTKASLRSSRSKVPEGEGVVFRGKLGRLGARIPTGGKLLELQVKQDKRTFQTVGEGFRTRPNGRYRIRYRFGDFYQYDVRFKFRLKVAREADWPYKAPVRSRPTKVTVLNR
jgi:hypothetical protein